MTRDIPTSMTGVLERLGLGQPTLVTSDEPARIITEESVRSLVSVVAARLRAGKWFLATDRRRVWEFTPAVVADPYSRNDPQIPRNGTGKIFKRDPREPATDRSLS